jgi:hypothetical protein
VSRNKSLPQPRAASIPSPPFPCCRCFHPVISDPAGFEVDLRLSVVYGSSPLLGGFAPYDCLQSPLLPG